MATSPDVNAKIPPVNTSRRIRVPWVKFYPDDWISGTLELRDDERGVYIQACMLIYARGGPITRALLKRTCSSHGNALNRILDKLVGLGKLTDSGLTIDQKRCENELETARKRFEKAAENGTKGNEIRWKGIAKRSLPESESEEESKKESPPLASLGRPPAGEAKAPDKRGTRLPEGFEMPIEWLVEAVAIRLKAHLPPVDEGLECERFCDYWHAKAGRHGTKLDWHATWRNWIRNANGGEGNGRVGRQRELSAVDKLYLGASQVGEELDRRERERARRRELERGRDPGGGSVVPLLDRKR